MSMGESVRHALRITKDAVCTFNDLNALHTLGLLRGVASPSKSFLACLGGPKDLVVQVKLATVPP